MKLTSNDYQELATQIEVGKGTIEFEKDGEILIIDYQAEEDGYVEDDYHCGYMNGTGAYVVTSRSLSILSVESFDEDGEDTENDFNDTLLEKEYEAAA